ncbi:GntR family transcriptional regulator [Mycetocola tolaasinivorans]|nr:GntR family transcriptional regulator [Mycetocola tolaasinivorans]
MTRVSTEDSLVGVLYATLRERIILGEYPQGAKLPETTLAADLNVSRVPIREVLPLLERDGLIRTNPRRSAVVHSWDHASVTDLFEVRLALEPLAAEYAARRVAKGTDPAPLHRAFADAVAAIEAGEPGAIAATNADLHRVILDLADNELLRQMMRPVLVRMNWIFYLTSDRDTDVQCSEHRHLVEAIAAGEGALARFLASAHVEGGRVPTFAALAGTLGENTE